MPSPPAAALIGKRAVDEAVGKHPVARLQRRTDRLVDMVGARGREQQSFGLGAPAGFVAAQQQLADALGAFASARLARHDDVDPARRAAQSASAWTWVDLPTPSPPSRLMKLAARPLTPSRTAA